MTDRSFAWRRAALAFSLALVVATAQAQPAAGASRGERNGDYIVAVVNQELVTAAEVEQRIARVRAEAERNRQQLPPPATLRQQVLDQLIDERVQVTNARDVG